MASNVSTVDGMGFEEVNQSSFTEMISGNNVYGTNMWISNMAELNIVSGATFSGGEFRESNRGILHSTAVENATTLYGYTVKAGSGKTGVGYSGLVHFKTNFANKNYFMTVSHNNWTLPIVANTGSTTGWGTSGARRASGCWVFGPSGTAFDWIAVGMA